MFYPKKQSFWSTFVVCLSQFKASYSCTVFMNVCVRCTLKMAKQWQKKLLLRINFWKPRLDYLVTPSYNHIEWTNSDNQWKHRMEQCFAVALMDILHYTKYLFDIYTKNILENMNCYYMCVCVYIYAWK